MQIANTCLVFLFYSDLKRIRTFVAKRREMSNTRFLVSFLTQIWLRQMRFDSDFTQTSDQRNGEWSLCSPAIASSKLCELLSYGRDLTLKLRNARRNIGNRTVLNNGWTTFEGRMLSKITLKNCIRPWAKVTWYIMDTRRGNLWASIHEILQKCLMGSDTAIAITIQSSSRSL